jgi:phosphohistidine phosphatase
VKTLLLLRHGKAHWGESMPDHDRTLRNRGLRDATRVGRFLEREGMAPDWVWTSTATRAADTAQIVVKAGDFDVPVEETTELYGADADEILAVVARTPDWAETVLAVGHNPGMEEAASALARQDVGMATCGLAAIELAAESWAEVNAATRGRLTGTWHPTELSADAGEAGQPEGPPG